METLHSSGLAITRMEKPAGEPTIAMVDAATSRMRAEHTDAVIALGGGSVIDTAKAARVCAPAQRALPGFLKATASTRDPSVPLIAVPTTAGDGLGGLRRRGHHRSRHRPQGGIAHPNLRPQYAVVDPADMHACRPSRRPTPASTRWRRRSRLWSPGFAPRSATRSRSRRSG